MKEEDFEEILKQNSLLDLSDWDIRQVIKAMKATWNKAIETAAKEVELDICDAMPNVDHYYDGEECNYIYVDKQSILKLKV